MSTPLIQSDESITTVFQTVNLRGAWTYDGCTRTWYSWSSSRIAGQNTLQTVSHRVGVIVDLVGAGTFAVAGIVPTTTTIPLCTGWNLVGNPSFRPSYTVLNLKQDTGATQVLGFSPAAPGNTVVLSDPTVLQPGLAYWVRVGAPSVWVVPGQ